MSKTNVGEFEAAKEGPQAETEPSKLEKSSSEEDDIQELALAFQLLDDPMIPDGQANDDISEEEEPPELRRSTRTTAGQHSNPYNLPRSVSRR